MVTSGDYERFVEVDGVRHHHIIDPRTGRPARGCQSVTVVGRDAESADALATAVFVLGPVEGLALVEDEDETETLIVDARGDLYWSSGFGRCWPRDCNEITASFRCRSTHHRTTALCVHPGHSQW